MTKKPIKPEQLAKCINLEQQVLFVVSILTADSSKDRFKSAEIGNYLVDTGKINVTSQAVVNILQNKDYFNKNKDGYKVMQKGLDYLERALSGGEIYYIEPGKPFNARYGKFKSVFNNTVGSVCIVDPYFDDSTIDFIYKNFRKGVSFKVITQKVKDKPVGTLLRQIKALRAEKYDVEVRIYSKSVLHDRYILDEHDLWFSGNSFNSLGAKESFLVKLGEDIRSQMEEVFNRRWKVSKPLS